MDYKYRIFLSFLHSIGQDQLQSWLLPNVPLSMSKMAIASQILFCPPPTIVECVILYLQSVVSAAGFSWLESAGENEWFRIFRYHHLEDPDQVLGCSMIISELKSNQKVSTTFLNTLCMPSKYLFVCVYLQRRNRAIGGNNFKNQFDLIIICIMQHARSNSSLSSQ